MKTTKVNGSNIRHSSFHKLPLNDVSSLMAKGNNKMCPPSEKKGFVKVKEHKKNSSGSYTLVAYGVASVEYISDANAGTSSYSDFILYNYGEESERKRNSSEPGNQP